MASTLSYTMAQKNVLLLHLCTSAVNFVSKKQTSNYCKSSYLQTLQMDVPIEEPHQQHTVFSVHLTYLLCIYRLEK